LDTALVKLERVAAGLGVAFMTDLTARTTSVPGVTFVPIREPELRMTMAVVWRPEAAVDSRAVRELVNLIYEMKEVGLLEAGETNTPAVSPDSHKALDSGRRAR
jgi:DNA-binding transcriptional LysR family regulator